MNSLLAAQPQWTARGKMIVAVYEEDVGRPAEGARVFIRPEGVAGGAEQLITDSVGRTETVDLPAPPEELSLDPEDTRFKPYSTYTIRVEREGSAPVEIEGAQVLAGTTALQEVRLSPVTAPPLDIEVPEHTLWGIFPPKIPEPEVKQLPDAGGFVVLSRPVVPETIVVHGGAPGANAPNYYVPFKDYIKNVCSCEIYSTWPAQSISANALAILSFTLNRIYTEWYRGRGFDFQITNSTAHDQAFTYGRNIFENISRIVDDLFTTYITRPGIRQPLLAQYCDGRRVTCPNWLSQWGSKSLGEQSLPPLDILRHYYGQDVYLMQAERVAGIPSSYPGTALREGSTGPAVRTIQEQLNTVAGSYPLIPRLRVDGVFGEQTRLAVETFQRIFDLSPDGVVGLGTWYALSNIYVAVTKMAQGTPRH